MPGGVCQPAPFVDPADRTADEVCDMYTFTIVDNDPAPYTQSADWCDLGVMSRDGYNDAFRRVNFYRWLSGTAPVTHDPDLDLAYSLGCLINVVNGTTTYSYSSSMECYDSRVGPAGSARGMQVGQKTAAAGIWTLFDDSGSDAWVNHRQPIVSHYARTVGIGFATDSRAPSYDSITIHGTGELGGSLPQGSPGFYTVPSHGFVPLPYAEMTYWSVHAPLPNGQESASRFQEEPSVTVLEDGVELVDGLVPARGAPYPEIWTDTVVLQRGDWTVKPGSTYSVTVVAAETFEFDVKPVQCE
jgi:hypothetical protein